MVFRKICQEDFKIINEQLKSTQYNGCEYQKIYLNAWPFFNIKSMEISIEDNIIFLRFHPSEKYVENGSKMWYYFAPLTTIDRVAEGIKKIEAKCNAENEKMQIINVPKEYVNLLNADNYSIKNDRDYAEYLYSVQDLTYLVGKKFHAKRNHILKFDKLYNYEFREYRQEDYDDVMKLFFNWYKSKQDEFFGEAEIEEEDEAYALRTELTLVLTEPNAFADVLIIDDKIVGFTLGEISASNVGIVHVEKCDISYEGIYAKINNLFVKKHFQNVRIINRQEDIGIEGLRKSKLSYNPIDFCEKNYIFNKE